MWSDEISERRSSILEVGEDEGDVDNERKDGEEDLEKVTVVS